MLEFLLLIEDNVLFYQLLEILNLLILDDNECKSFKIAYSSCRCFALFVQPQQENEVQNLVSKYSYNN